MLFCRDVDLLYWEPGVMADAAFASQTLARGTGDLSGALLGVTAGPSLTAQEVAAGHIVVFSGAHVGCYVITDVEASMLTFTAIYDEPFPESGSPPAAIGAGAGTVTGVAFAVRTFWAQRQVVSDLLLQSIGLVPGTEAAADAAVLNPLALRRACVLGTLQMIYSALAAAAAEPAKFTVRAELYERLYRRALLAAQVDLDLDGDGRADVRRSPGLVRAVRV